MRSAHAGLTLEPSDPVALADAITHLASLPAAARDQLGRNGRAYLGAHFEKQTVIDGYERVLNLLAGSAQVPTEKAAERL